MFINVKCLFNIYYFQLYHYVIIPESDYIKWYNSHTIYNISVNLIKTKFDDFITSISTIFHSLTKVNHIRTHFAYNSHSLS